MMFGGGMGWGWGAGSVFGPIFMVLVWVFFIAAVVWVVLALTRSAGTATADRQSGALRILEDRFARGEIDAEELRARRQAIGG